MNEAHTYLPTPDETQDLSHRTSRRSASSCRRRADTWDNWTGKKYPDLLNSGVHQYLIARCLREGPKFIPPRNGRGQNRLIERSQLRCRKIKLHKNRKESVREAVARVINFRGGSSSSGGIEAEERTSRQEQQRVVSSIGRGYKAIDKSNSS